MGYRKLTKSPIICEPRDTMTKSLGILGWVSRALVLFACVLGSCLFIADSFGITSPLVEDAPRASVWIIILASLAVTAASSVAAVNKTALKIVPPAYLAALAGIFALIGRNPITLAWEGIKCVWNTAIHRLAEGGYMSFSAYGLPAEYSFEQTTLLNVGMTLVATVFGVIFALCLIKRGKMIPTAIVCVLLLVPVFTYNLTRTGVGMTCAIIFIVSALSMCLYDRRYSGREFAFIERREKKKNKKEERRKAKAEKKRKKAILKKRSEYAYETALAVSDDRKVAKAARRAVYTLDVRDKKEREKALKEEAAEKKRAERKAKKEKRAEDKKARAAAKKENKRLRAAAKKDKALAKRLADEKKERTAKKTAAKKELRAAKRAAEHEVNEKKRMNISAGGVAGLAAVVLAVLAVAIPALAINGKFPVIPFINKPISVARAYITAYLTGDDIDLNDLDVYGELSELAPRTLSFDPLEFKQIQIFAVGGDLTNNVYLRSWMARDFDAETQTWMGADTDQVVEFRSRFGRKFTPDSIRTDFYSLVHPTAVEMFNNNATMLFARYGFDVERVNVRRINSGSKIVFVPAMMNSEYSILDYGTLDPVSAKYSYFYDGIYSSRFFDREQPYSAVSFITDMRDRESGQGIADSIRYLELAKTYIGDVDKVKELLSYRELEEGEYADIETDEGRVYSVNAEDLSDINTKFEEALKAEGIRFTGESLVKRAMNDEDVIEAIEDFEKTESRYSEYAHEAYTGNVGSERVAELADTLLADAGYEKQYNRLGKFVGFFDKNGERVCDDDVIMTVMSYLRENYEYTLTPTAPEAEEGYDVLDAFLFDTKEGYCTHFATAACALVRDFGYPVRFCEGYIAHDLHRDYARDAKGTYTTFVLDEDAHAWIEVYIEGYGWQQYECTPIYAEPMYDPTYVNVQEEVDPNFVPTEPREDEEDNLIVEPEPEEIAEEDEEINYGRIFLIIGIVVGSILIIFAVLRIIWGILSHKAKKETDRRYEAVRESLDDIRKVKTPESNRELALELNDQIMTVLHISGLDPEDGEGVAEFSEKIGDFYGGLSDTPTREIVTVMMQAEFGTQITQKELWTLGDFLHRLVPSVYGGLNPIKKLYWRYFKRMI